MRTFTTLTTFIACVLLLALPASSAWANAADDRIVNDCTTSPTGSLRGNYPQSQLNHALHNLVGDVREYTGCHDAIKQALIASAGGGDGGANSANGDGGSSGDIGGTGDGSGSSGGGGSLATGDASAPVPDAPPPAGAEKPLDVAGAAVAPGALPEIGQDSHQLPTPLLVLLGLLGLAALAAAALTIGRRVVGHHGA